MLRKQLNGIQHVGIPTNDIETTVEFYRRLGFEVSLVLVIEASASVARSTPFAAVPLSPMTPVRLLFAVSR